MPNIGFATRISSVGLLTGLAWLLRVGCVVVVLYVVADAVWYFVVGPTTQADDTTYAAVATDRPKEVDVTKILTTELFGSSAATEQRAPVEDLKETTLNLSLEGTLVAADSASGSKALISSKDRRGEAKKYREGDAVASFAAIEEIHSSFVVISRGGEREMLRFKRDNLFQATQSTPPVRVPKTRAPQSINDKLLQELRTVRESDGDASSQFTIEDLKPLGLTEIQTNDGPMLAIEDTTGTSPLAQLGVQPGDIVMSVNGYTLSALRHDKQLEREVLGGNTAEFEIRRANRQFKLTVPMP